MIANTQTAKNVLELIAKNFAFDVMSDSHPNQPPTDSDQNAHARLVLIQVQWLMTILLMSGLLWLGNNQRQLEHSVNDRLAATEHLRTRINDLDDRLFAVSPAQTRQTSSRNASNDWQIVSVQMSSVERLYAQGDYGNASELLKSIDWQLGNENLNLATPLKIALKQAIKDDLTAITTQQNSPDDWQVYTLKLQALQRYVASQLSQDNELSKTELALHTAHTFLGLAIADSKLHRQETINLHLIEIQNQLAWLVKHGDYANANNTNDATQSTIGELSVDNLDGAMAMINELLGNPPKKLPLISPQLLGR